MNASNHFTQIAGIVGGVGPEATNYFVSLVVKMRFAHAKRDQDHIPYLLFNNPQIPDRTEYLLGGKESPLPELIHTAKILKSAGATFIAIPCNTAQTFGKQVEKAAGVSVLNMVELTAKHILNTYGRHITVGLLATDGTIKSNIYQEEFEKLNAGISVIIPNARKQKNVMNAIYDIKSVSANEANSELLIDASRQLASQGASVIILGCTEIPLALGIKDNSVPTVDPMEIMAREVLKRTLLSETHPHTLPCAKCTELAAFLSA